MTVWGINEDSVGLKPMQRWWLEESVIWERQSLSVRGDSYGWEGEWDNNGWREVIDLKTIEKRIVW